LAASRRRFSIMSGPRPVKDFPMPRVAKGRDEQKWMDHLVIVRHGESERNVGKDEAVKAGQLEYGGGLRDMDVALTSQGRRQAEATGAYLSRHFQFDRVFVSPYLRTLRTAELLVKPFKKPPRITIEERIREKEFGIL